MEPEKKPKVRVVKKGAVRLKSGIITVEDKSGKTFYRCACDRCTTVVTVAQPPYDGKEFVCGDCKFVADKGKPSTTVSRRGDSVTYFTLCDRCGTKQKTPFLPKNDRQFLCDGCLRTEPQRETRPMKKDVQVMGTKKEPLYWVPCDGCATKTQLKFAPRPGEPFFCFNCFEKRRTGEILPQPEEDAAAPTKTKDTQAPAPAEPAAEAKPAPAAKKPGKQPLIEKSDRWERSKPKGEGVNSGTSVMIHIECVKCGRKETLNFHPSNVEEPICTTCFDSMNKSKPKSRRK